MKNRSSIRVITCIALMYALCYFQPIVLNMLLNVQGIVKPTEQQLLFATRTIYSSYWNADLLATLGTTIICLFVYCVIIFITAVKNQKATF